MKVRIFCARCGADVDREQCSCAPKPRSTLFETVMRARELVHARGDGDMARALEDVVRAEKDGAS